MPDNAGYMHAAYAVAAAAYALYGLSLWRRRRVVRAELERSAAPGETRGESRAEAGR